MVLEAESQDADLNNTENKFCSRRSQEFIQTSKNSDFTT